MTEDGGRGGQGATPGQQASGGGRGATAPPAAVGAAGDGPEPRRRIQDLGLAAGPLLALGAYFALPDSYVDAAGAELGFGHVGRATAAVAVWMAAWWLSEALSVHATALLPLVLLPLLGARSMAEAAAPYAHPLIFLFLGGFLLALSMERWGLHRRIALGALRLTGDRPAAMVGGFMGVSALLSMWVSNTATAIMMLPVALSVVDLVARGLGDASRDPNLPPLPLRSFALALLLGIAYAASIGGVATPIGTPPNLFLLSFVRSELGREVSFVRWLTAALPLVLVFLPLAWWLLTRRLFPLPDRRIEGGRRLIRDALRQLGPLQRGERLVLAVFVLTASLWITRPVLNGLRVAGERPLAGLTDPGIAMLAALLLFVAPVGRRPLRFVLDWETARAIPWGILLLFGGGLSLAAAIQHNGVGELLGAQVSALRGVPAPLVVLGVVAGILFLTELTSNTATTATLVPILAALAPGLGLDPMLLVVPAAVAASFAFMLPVATPPNAVVFGSGHVNVGEMVRAGFWLNLIGVVLVTGFAFLALPLLGGP